MGAAVGLPHIQAGYGVPVALKPGGINAAHRVPALPAVPVRPPVVGRRYAAVAVAVKGQVGAQLVPHAAVRADLLAPPPKRPIVCRPMPRVVGIVRRPVPVQVVPDDIQLRHRVNVNQVVVVPVVIPLRRIDQAPVLQQRVVQIRPEIPGVVVPGLPVQVPVPGGVNPGVPGGLPQLRRRFPRAGVRTRAGRLPRADLVPVGSGHRPRGRIAPRQPPGPPGRPARHRPQRVDVRNRAPVVETRHSARVARCARAGRRQRVGSLQRAAVAPHQPPYAVIDAAGHRAAGRNGGDGAVIPARHAAHIGRRGPAARHLDLRQRQRRNLPAAAHRPEQPQVGRVAAADVQVRDAVTLPVKPGGKRTARRPNGQPARAAVPVRGVIAVNAAVPVLVKIQVGRQLEAHAVIIVRVRGGGRAAHIRGGAGKGRPPGGGIGRQRRPVPVHIPPDGIQLCQRGHLNVPIVIAVIVFRAAGADRNGEWRRQHAPAARGGHAVESKGKGFAIIGHRIGFHPDNDLVPGYGGGNIGSGLSAAHALVPVVGNDGAKVFGINTP